MTPIEWLRLAPTLVALAVSITAAATAHHNARRARQAAAQARAAARRSWGDVARGQLVRMKIEQLRQQQ